MRRLAIGLFAALLGLGSMTPQAEARDRYDSDRYDSGRYSEHQYRRDPLFQALRNSQRILLNNYYDGHRYRDAGRWIPSHEVRFAGKSWGGGYRIWFRGQYHDAYTRWYRGKLCLYLGHAPTGPGYRYELVLG